MLFLAQLDLVELARFSIKLELPSSGWLLFFYSAEQPWGTTHEDAGGWSVLYAVPGDRVVRSAPPQNLKLFPEVGLQFESCRTAADPWSCWYDRSNLTVEERFEINEITEAYVNENSQIGGHPSVIQEPMEVGCELLLSRSLMGDADGFVTSHTKQEDAKAQEWRLLLQLESCDEADMMWGDNGKLYFWIRREDLVSRRFDRVWMMKQCY